MGRTIRFARVFVLVGVVAVPSLALADASGAAGSPAPQAVPTEPSADFPNVGQREGLTWGLSVGRGSIDVECSFCGTFTPLTEALSMTAHVGWMLNENLAIGVEHWTVRYNDRGSEWFNDNADHLVAQRITTVSAQVWLGRRLWFKAGAGAGKHISDLRYARLAASRAASTTTTKDDLSVPVAEAEDMETTGEYTPALTAAIGFEVARRTDVAVDVQFRIGTTRRPSNEFQVLNTGMVFGISWY